jgi:hypothetical protein
LDIIGSIDNVMSEETGAPGENYCQRESPSLSHEEQVQPQFEPTRSDVTGANLSKPQDMGLGNALGDDLFCIGNRVYGVL